jgi:gliding motility-associated-like protein
MRILIASLFFVISLTPIANFAQTPAQTICVNSAINYTEFNTGGSVSSVGWEWTFEGGVPATANVRQPSVTYPNTGLFKATCVSIFPNGDRDTNSAYILVIDGIIQPIPINDTTICAPSINLLLDVQNNNSFNRFLWTSTDVTLSAADTLRTLRVTRAGTYNIRITNICNNANKTIIVKQGELPTIDLGADQFVCRNISITLSAGTNTSYSYKWLPTNETTSTITANIAGTYTATITSADGCSATDQINLIDSCPPVIWLPNAFTPNAAAPNDVFKPYLEGFKFMNMRIYNRWGAKVFETEDLYGSWDGQYENEPAIEGTYVALLELIGNDGFRKVIFGEFLLLR